MLIDGSNLKNETEQNPEEYSTGLISETAVSLFQKNSTLYPDRIAVSLDEKYISYYKLNEHTSQLAISLQNRGICRGDVVAVKMERSIELVVAILGILKSGAAFVCIDPDYPEPRIRYMIQNSGAKCLISDDSFTEPGCISFQISDFSFDAKTNYISPELKSDDLSYVVFTSGTTGNPKGSMITHAGLVNMIQHHQKLFSVTPEDAVLQFASISFDASVFELFLAMLTGATLVLIRKEVIYDKEQFIKYLQTHRVTITLLPPVFLSSLNRADLKPLRVLITGGEACNLEDALYYSTQLRFFNAYGPSEASVIVSIHEVKQENKYEKYIPIGKAIDNIRFHALNEELKPVTKGETGDLYVSGIGLAKGYINNEELSSRSFIKGPGNLVLYKTGDLVREMPDGEFVILGRKDSQVKILGHRIELSAIESVMNSLESVSNSLVTAHEDSRGGKFLCGYYVSEIEISAVAMRERMLKQLPVFMIPQHLIQVKEFVLNQSGKVDKTKLPKPEEKNIRGEEYTSEPEMSLASIWKQVLELKQISSSEHFFTAGGHSLKAAELVTRIYKTFHIKLKVADVYEAPVFSDMVDVIRRSTGTTYNALTPAPVQKYYPLSSAQRRMYIVSMSGKQDISYNVSVVLEFASGIPVDIVRSATNDLVKRHEILRTRYVIDGEDIVQEIVECLPEIEIKNASKNEISIKAREFVRPFDLSKAPVLRVGYFHIEGGGCAVVFDSHHIAVDGTSVGILVKEFIAMIQQEPVSIPSFHYKDYAVWESQNYKSGYFKEHENFWLSMYDTLPEFSIPVDYEAGREKQFSGSRIVHQFDKSTIDSVYKFINAQNISLFQFFLANYYLLLSKYTASDDVVVGTAVANRNSEEVQNMPGMFVNTLAVRMKIKADWTFKTLLKEVQQMMLNCFHYQEYPFEKLVERLGLVGINNRVPLIDTTIVVQNLDFFTKEFSEDLTCKYENYADTSKFAISVFIIENAGNFTMQIDYNTHVLRKETVEFLVKSFSKIIEKSIRSEDSLLSTIGLMDDNQIEAMRQIISDKNNAVDIEFDF